jgi:hypothetical protein
MMSISTQEQEQKQKQLQLHGDQAYMTWLARGTMLIVESGSARVSRAGSAMVDAMPMEEIVLHEGECHIVERSGWLCLRGHGRSAGGRLTCIRQIELHAASARGGHFLRRVTLLLGSLRLGTSR